MMMMTLRLKQPTYLSARKLFIAIFQQALQYDEIG
jgi:hypothetical protein